MNNFGPNIWKNLCIVVSHWSSSQEKVRERSRQRPPLTIESRTQGYLEKIHEDFPASQAHNISFYFINPFEIGEEYDKTSTALAEILAHAMSNPFFDCKDCIACTYPQWVERKPIILARAEVLKTLV